MTGEEVLQLTRLLANDHNIGSYTQINRALRRYCRETGFTWLRQVDDAALIFRESVNEYMLPDLGFRRIDRVWVQDDESNRWLLLNEADPLAFEAEVRKWRESDGDDEENRPRHYKIEGNVLTVTPTPDQDYNARLDGIVDTPVVERTKQLPGPQEYHEVVARLAAAYHVQARAQVVLENATNEVEIAKAQQMFGLGNRGEQQSVREIQAFVVRDSEPNRMHDLQWDKVKLMK